MLKTGKYLAILAILTIFEGCASTPVDVKIGLPDRPVLVPILQVEWERLSPAMQDTIQHNDISLKKWGRKLEERIILHDEGR